MPVESRVHGRERGAVVKQKRIDGKVIDVYEIDDRSDASCSDGQDGIVPDKP
jgi:hypothetical protein